MFVFSPSILKCLILVLTCSPYRGYFDGIRVAYFKKRGTEIRRFKIGVPNMNASLITGSKNIFVR